MRTKKRAYLREKKEGAVCTGGEILLLRIHNLGWHSFLSDGENDLRESTEISALQDYYGTDIFCSQKLSLLKVGGISALKTSLLISFSVKRKTSAVVSGLRKLRLGR